MVRQDILEGLRRATLTGSTLQQAMMSFFNAGYTKEDIEEAARTLVSQQVNPQYSIPARPQPVAPQTTNYSQTQTPLNKPAPVQSPPVAPQPVYSQPAVQQQTYSKPIQQTYSTPAPVQQTRQIISNYEPNQEKKNTWIVIVLLIVLVLLIGALVATFLFKDQITTFFTNLFNK